MPSNAMVYAKMKKDNDGTKIGQKAKGFFFAFFFFFEMIIAERVIEIQNKYKPTHFFFHFSNYILTCILCNKFS